ncbi:hypothetical protein BGZ97_004704 [Linnemannia gamsii]|uniref:Uncharacterized protein n=1 Tax=Linnemannia gamsii TaxID=64522 RepID=A0A9P6RLZ8_9FUNG|nr:hypothetical protein BGZ97_004704 [Linnemannia gamsii]
MPSPATISNAANHSNVIALKRCGRTTRNCASKVLAAAKLSNSATCWLTRVASPTSARSGATVISHNGACKWKLNAAAAKVGPNRRPQLSPELIVANAAMRFSGPDRCIAQVCAAGTMPATVRPYSARETTNPVTPQKALTTPVAIPHTTSAITAKLIR